MQQQHTQYTVLQDNNITFLTMAKETITTTIFEKQEDGTTIVVDTITEEVEVPSTEELIAEKEAKLLKMYEELEALKSQSAEK